MPAKDRRGAQLRRDPGDPHAMAGRIHVHLVALTAGLDRDAEEWIGSEYGDLRWLTYEAHGGPTPVEHPA